MSKNFVLRLRQPAFLIAGGLFILSLILYVSTLAPSVVTIFDDSLEFQLVTYQLGIAHPTGYPLYTLLGKLFTLLPVGNVAYRVNLMSAVFGAATVTLLYLLILQVGAPKERKSGWRTYRANVANLQGKGGEWSFAWPTHLGGLSGALLLAVGLIFWQQATIAEVYTLNAFFVVLLLLLVTIPISKNKEKQRIWWLAFLFGLSLTHHRTMLLLLPALGFYLYLTYGAQLFKLKTLILSVVLVLLPLLLYLYLPWRGHIGSLDGTYQNTWAGFWRQVSASGYGLFIFDNPFGHERNVAFYWNLLADQFYTTILGVIGLAYLFRIGQRKMLVLTGVAFLTYLSFNLFYNVTDIEVFFIPIFILWAVWSGIGAAFLLHAAAGIKLTTDDRRRTTDDQSSGSKPWPGTSRWRWQSILVITTLVIFAFIISQLFWTNYPILSTRYTWQVHDYGLDMLQQPPPSARQPTIVGILGEMTLLRYFQQTENRRPDIETVAADLEADRLATVADLLAAGQEVYLTRRLPGATEHWSLSAVGPLIQVNPEPVTVSPPFSLELNQAITPEITLLGYTVSRPPHTGPGPAPLRLTLFWQAGAPITTDLKVSARLLTSAGEVQAVVDAGPVHFAYPTTAWRPGEIISDVYDLVLPVGTPTGPYTPLIIWYDPVQNAAEVGRVELDPLMIE